MTGYKFQKLKVYQLSLNYIKAVYSLSKTLPGREKFNLSSQIEKAATSIALNTAEGSTGQTNLEQKWFLSMAIRSYLETIACLDLIDKLEYLSNHGIFELKKQGHQLFVKLIAFRKALR